MVRTYYNQISLSPWEKAMQNADNHMENNHTGRKMFSNVNTTTSSIKFNSDNNNAALPPIKEGRQKMLKELEYEVGKAASRLKEKFGNIKRECSLYDPTNNGYISINTIAEILKRFKVPEQEAEQKILVASFTENEKVRYTNVLDYILHCQTLFENKVKESQKTTTYEIVPQTSKADSLIGRFDSTASSQSERQSEYRPNRKEVAQQRLNDRRDASLMIEVDKALKNTRIDRNELIDALEETLILNYTGKTIVNEQMKKLVERHNLPLNPALTLKCIQVCDTENIGKIRWENFINLLRKSVGERKQNSDNKSGNLPIKAQWETTRPLSDISSKKTKRATNDLNESFDSNDDINVNYSSSSQNSYEWNNFGTSTSEINHQNNNFNYVQKKTPLIMTPENYENQEHTNQFNSKYENETKYETRQVQIDDDIEAAFFNSLQQIRNEKKYQQEYTTPKIEFSRYGARGEIYKKVAQALYDKGKRTNGNIMCDEVRKLINYYNLILDADFNDEQVQDLLLTHSNNDQIRVEDFVNAFGTKIL
ncbi:uncharacterized protein LOC105846445 [Hydra vulgaris]|uniref:uncharacterized protein LOC105846445 n=1 Tax=Hydra vulgaris TaxID=6087 RepID=UPI001F5E81D1|nr:uncharacterized protein LOC105846445 [Hydra vulgaris]